MHASDYASQPLILGCEKVLNNISVTGNPLNSLNLNRVCELSVNLDKLITGI